MGVHFVFLWGLFSGDGQGAFTGPVEFVEQAHHRHGPVASLARIFRGAWNRVFLFADRARLRAGSIPAAGARSRVTSDSIAGALIGGFYARIIVMHVAILAGGFLSFFGSIAPLIILIAIKTAVDLGMHFAFDPRDADKTFRALMRHDAQQRQGGRPDPPSWRCAAAWGSAARGPAR